MNIKCNGCGSVVEEFDPTTALCDDCRLEDLVCDDEPDDTGALNSVPIELNGVGDEVVHCDCGLVVQSDDVDETRCAACIEALWDELDDNWSRVLHLRDQLRKENSDAYFWCVRWYVILGNFIGKNDFPNQLLTTPTSYTCISHGCIKNYSGEWQMFALFISKYLDDNYPNSVKKQYAEGCQDDGEDWPTEELLPISPVLYPHQVSLIRSLKDQYSDQPVLCVTKKIVISDRTWSHASLEQAKSRLNRSFVWDKPAIGNSYQRRKHKRAMKRLRESLIGSFTDLVINKSRQSGWLNRLAVHTNKSENK